MKNLILFLLLLVVGCGSDRNLSQVKDVTNIGNTQQILTYVSNESSQLDPLRFSRFVRALNIQLQRDLLPAWRVNAVALEGVSLTGERTVSFVDSVPPLLGDFGQVLGAHNNYRRGFVLVPRAEVSGQVEVAGSHEVLELLLNEFADSGGYEIGDPVDGTFYLVEVEPGVLVMVSNFVLPAWYVPGSAGPWDYLGLTTGPLQPLPGRRAYNQVH